MKRKNKLAVILIILVLIVLLVFAIVLFRNKSEKVDEKEQTKTEQRSNVKETDAETGEEYYLLGDFENYFECSQVAYNASFGTITPITKEEEPDMVPYGNQSVKLKILGTEESFFMLRPTMRFSTKSALFDETSDFSNVSRISFDIYNTQDYEASVRFYIDNQEAYVQDRSYLYNTDYHNCPSIILDLEPNSWNHIEIPAEDIKVVNVDKNGSEYMAYGVEALKNVCGINIEFDRGEIHEEQEVFYFDNLRAYLKNE